MRSSSSSRTDSTFWKEHSSIARSPCRSIALPIVSLSPAAGSSARLAATPLPLPLVAVIWSLCLVGELIALHSALALAAFHLEGRVAVPVDELVHRLQVEVDRQRQVLDDLLELGRTHAPGERAP